MKAGHFLAVGAVGAAVVAAATMSSHGHGAQAADVAGHSATTSASALSVMCADVAKWNRHRTDANLFAATAASFRVTWKWPGADMDQLYVDVRDGSHKYIASDVKTILTEDCKK